MSKLVSLFLATLLLAVVASAQNVSNRLDDYQVRYFANLGIGDSIVNLTNTGLNGGTDPAGEICANVYVFDPQQELIACCSCPITPNGLATLSAQRDLTSNLLTQGVPTSITVGLIASADKGGCDAAAVTAPNVVGGLRAWGTTLHVVPAPVTPLATPGTVSLTYALTETEFSQSALSLSELTHLTSECGFIETGYRPYGICSACGAAGVAGAVKQ
jgi:hypothetical protein